MGHDDKHAVKHTSGGTDERAGDRASISANKAGRRSERLIVVNL